MGDGSDPLAFENRSRRQTTMNSLDDATVCLSETAFTLRAALRSAALIDCIVINGSIHTESSDAQRRAAARIKFETSTALWQ